MRKLFLPVNQALRDSLEPPTVTAMRKRLGGRVVPQPSTGPSVGDCVALASGGSARTGVVLHAEAGRVDVYLDHGVVHRAPLDALRALDGAPPEALTAIATSARVFAALHEGEAVRVRPAPDAGAPAVGATLREKCRYGALVETADGNILGVGFQRLEPAT